MALKLLDVASIWGILSKILAGSTTHDDNSSPSIFHNIVAISSSLMRMRRDLVLSTLPHMSAVLSRLMMALRNLRPQLGGKQRRAVTDTLPFWINHEHPLSAEEGKSLARLLTNITAKTVVRPFGGGAAATQEQSKAESLARPFAKHAGYILAAYIQAVNEPLCVMPTALRKELEPGLYTLCAVMGEEGRNALVGGLDAGGKSLLKILWSSFEKQKYIGRG